MSGAIWRPEAEFRGAGWGLMRAGQWLDQREYMRRHRYELTIAAGAEFPESARVAGTPLLARPEWLAPAPVPLRDIALEWRDTVVPAPPRGSASLLPERADGSRYPSYAAAIADLAAPAVFENRRTYRLLDADLTVPRLVFTRGRYFDGVNAGEPAAHEFAARQLAGVDGNAGVGGNAGVEGDARRADSARAGDPLDLASRPANMAISTLTLRLDRETGQASFPLHWRDPAKVGHAGGLYQVIPVGLFQPSGEAAWNEAADFSLWRNMIREFAEELRGEDEDHGSERAPLDYDGWPFARTLTQALDTGQARAWCLGLGVDPLSYATDLLTVVVIDARLYDELFADGAQENAEGRVLATRPFDKNAVGEHEPMQAAGAALLRLAWRSFAGPGLRGRR
jgi:hypothetical protein